VRGKIFPYVFIRRAQAKTMLKLSRDLLLPSASFCQLSIMSRWSGRQTTSRRLEGQSHRLRYSKADGSKTGIFLKLPLSITIISWCLLKTRIK